MGYVHLERTLGGSTCSGCKVNFCDESTFGKSNLQDLRAMHNSLGMTDATAALLTEFWAPLEDALNLKPLGEKSGASASSVPT